MLNISPSIITPKHFKMPELQETVFLFFIQQHFFLFHDLVNGGKIKSYGPAKRFSFSHKGSDCSALGGFIGAPLAVIIAENAITSGAKHIKAFGTAGCIGSQTIEVGEVHRPMAGLDETGIIKDYEGTDSLTKFHYEGKLPSCRNIVSVNSFYRLTEGKLDQYRVQNIDIIDMEAVALNYVTKIQGATFEPLFVISDKVNPDLSWQYEYKSKRLLSGIESGLQQLIL